MLDLAAAVEPVEPSLGSKSRPRILAQLKPLLSALEEQVALAWLLRQTATQQTQELTQLLRFGKPWVVVVEVVEQLLVDRLGHPRLLGCLMLRKATALLAPARRQSAAQERSTLLGTFLQQVVAVAVVVALALLLTALEVRAETSLLLLITQASLSA
jgi:hypothetical protein